MNTFSHRITLQRETIKIVNSSFGFNYKLNSLSQKAIDDWANKNRVSNSKLTNILYNISNKLGFLSNKSQEQITEDYQEISSYIKDQITIIGQLKIQQSKNRA